MLGGYYTIASGMLTRQREIDVIGNNLLNINTPGYHTERVLTGTFDMEMMQRLNNGGGLTQIGEAASTSAIVESVEFLDHGGVIKDTGRSFDFAVSGPGMYMIKTDEDDMVYTRNGQFDRDEEGYLCLPGVGRVQGVNGDILLENINIFVSPEGLITNQDGEDIATIVLMELADEEGTMTKLGGSNTYAADGDMVAVPANTSTSHQRYLELSNVDTNLEMTTLVSVQRGFQSCSSALSTLDALNKRAVSSLGALT